MNANVKDPALMADEKAYQTNSPPDSGSGQIVTNDDAYRPGFWTRMGLTGESFKQRTLSDKHNQLNKTMKARHLNMIAIGGSIGAGLFAGSGNALYNGGPAGLLIAFAIIGVVRGARPALTDGDIMLTAVR